MTNDIWTDRLSEYVDDALAAGEKRALELHVGTCVECRSALAELRAVVARLRAEPADRAPSEAWARLAPRLVAQPRRRDARPVRGWAIAVRAAAAGVAIAATLGAGMVLGVSIDRGELTIPGIHPGRLSRAQQVTQRGRDLAPAADSLVQRSVRMLDSAIADAGRAAAGDPGNEALATYARALAALRDRHPRRGAR